MWGPATSSSRSVDFDGIACRRDSIVAGRLSEHSTCRREDSTACIPRRRSCWALTLAGNDRIHGRRQPAWQDDGHRPWLRRTPGAGRLRVAIQICRSKQFDRGRKSTMQMAKKCLPAFPRHVIAPFRGCPAGECKGECINTNNCLAARRPLSFDEAEEPQCRAMLLLTACRRQCKGVVTNDPSGNKLRACKQGFACKIAQERMDMTAISRRISRAPAPSHTMDAFSHLVCRPAQGVARKTEATPNKPCAVRPGAYGLLGLAALPAASKEKCPARRPYGIDTCTRPSVMVPPSGSDLPSRADCMATLPHHVCPASPRAFERADHKHICTLLG